MAKKPRNWKAHVDAIRNILITHWEPIGCGVPEDEYDNYIPAIYRQMHARVDAAALEVHLQEIETQSLGLVANPQRNRHVAKMLLELMEEWERD